LPEKLDENDDTLYSVVCQHWIESTRGGKRRLDGATLHLARKDRNNFVKEFWDAEKLRNPSGRIPDSYSRTIIDVKLVVYRSILNAKKEKASGIWIDENMYHTLVQPIA